MPPRTLFCPKWIALSLGLLLFVSVAYSQTSKYEFRGVWYTTVSNLDWPTNRLASTAEQQQELRNHFDSLQRSGINVIFFQIRTQSDAFYESALEPWSYFLTGQQGQAPSPFYDPLAFAIEEAHQRGMELHAWINPFRAENRVGAFPIADAHVTRTHPEWILQVDNYKFLNPGLPEVRAYILEVITDVVERYDIDGVHFDDYFYPYPSSGPGLGIQDWDTFQAHNPLNLSGLGAWRTYNINTFIRETYETITARKPYLKFGVSPFGIWRSGVPEGISGLSSVDIIYADPKNWLEQGWVDYIAPQLYWPFGGGQDYAKLAPWWASIANGYHIYPGHAIYRADPATSSGTLYQPTEVPRQVRFNRAEDGIQGSIFFRAKNLTTFRTQGFADTLRTSLYSTRALPPIMRHKDLLPPAAPFNLRATESGSDAITLAWDEPFPTGFEALTRRFAIYRVQSATPPDAAGVVLDPTNLLTLTSTPLFVDRPPADPTPYYYIVTAVSGNSVESEVSNSVAVEGRAVVSTEEAVPQTFTMEPAYPNPFNASTTLRFSLERAEHVWMRVYNTLGQEVITLFAGEWLAPGTHDVVWDGRNAQGQAVGSGTYMYSLKVGQQTYNATVIRIR